MADLSMKEEPTMEASDDTNGDGMQQGEDGIKTEKADQGDNGVDQSEEGGDSTGMKRQHPQPGGKIKRKRKRSTGPQLPKNALMRLNELKPGLEYKVISQVGPVHAPAFTMCVEVNGQAFEGTGPTKKKAKLCAAENALRSFVQFPAMNEAFQSMAGQMRSGDFTQDGDQDNPMFNNFEGTQTGAIKEETKPAPPTAAAKEQLPGKNPVMILNELRPGSRFDVICETGEAHSKNFVMSVTIDDKQFTGSGRSKKLAKARASQKALESLYNLEFQSVPDPTDPMSTIPAFSGNVSDWLKHKVVNPNKKPIPKSPTSKATPTFLADGGKNAIQLLNELFHGLMYETKETSEDAENKTFEVTCQINDVTYTAPGPSKKAAKLACAEKAYSEMSTSPDWGSIMSMKKERRQRHLDRKRDWWNKRLQGEAEGAMPDWKIKRAEKIITGSKQPALPQNAVGRLNDFYPGLRYILDNKGTFSKPSWTADVDVSGTVFKGTGASKQEAKVNAAEKAMKRFNIKYKGEGGISKAGLLNTIATRSGNNAGRWGFNKFGGGQGGGRGGNGRGGNARGGNSAQMVQRLKAMASGGTLPGFVKAANPSGGNQRGRGRGRGQGSTSLESQDTQQSHTHQGHHHHWGRGRARGRGRAAAQSTTSTWSSGSGFSGNLDFGGGYGNPTESSYTEESYNYGSGGDSNGYNQSSSGFGAQSTGNYGQGFEGYSSGYNYDSYGNAGSGTSSYMGGGTTGASSTASADYYGQSASAPGPDNFYTGPQGY